MSSNSSHQGGDTENIADKYKGGGGPDWKDLKEDGRTDKKLIFRMSCIAVAGISCLIFCLLPDSCTGVPFAQRGPAWTIIGVIVGNLVKGVLD
jgi:hypothetical protein